MCSFLYALALTLLFWSPRASGAGECSTRCFAGLRDLEAEASGAGTGGVGYIPWAISGVKFYHLKPSGRSLPHTCGYF